MDPITTTIVFVGLLLFLLAIGLNIAFSLMLVGTVGLFFHLGPNQAINALGVWPFSFCYSYLLVVVPLFILMGHLAFSAGISRNLYDFAYKWVGQLPGGLAMASVMASAGFAAVTGSSAATVATIGKIAYPEMKRYRYESKLSTGTIASSGMLGPLIPPSVIVAVYGYVTRESIGAVLIAGILPGILTAAMFMLMIFIRCKINPNLAPLAPPIKWKEKIASIPQVWGMLVLFGIFISTIYTGLATPTEAGAIGTLAALVIALVLRTMGWSSFRNGLLDAGKVTAMVFAVVMGSSMFGLFLSSTGVPTQMAEWVSRLEIPKILILVGMLFIYIPLGCLLEPISMMLLTLPVLYPMAKSLGFDGVWFGILIVKVVELGMITPPVGINVYVMAGIAPDVKMEDIFRGCVWFFFTDCITMAILIMYPQIVLWLPRLMSLC